jgi:hypothetical protein
MPIIALGAPATWPAIIACCNAGGMVCIKAII